ncbi:putative ABC transport system permease protein [Chitinophaga sp. CF118]|uniref:ABC transporter permease n=1 Tax=Chitinophaga sp. CF118 TaxID=1884367 RepID=UPI0008E2F387|nr:ABC transporter permease [Chitinophaga sp. CF118]SFE73454.1 putative ABC transport system permease protein [Chitinophaga sp. CF118]
MFKNYFKVTWRNIRKQKFYSTLNILGLTIGMTCCFLIFMYVRFEQSYDTFHKRGPQIYRVVTDVKTPTELIEGEITSGPMGPNMKTDFPEVLNMVRVDPMTMLVQKDGNAFEEANVISADSTFFKVFSFPLIRGNEATALKEPFSVVLTESAARKYFGNADPLGQALQIEGNKYTVKVTGIIKDVPENSHLPFNMIFSMTTATIGLKNGLDNNWGNFGMHTYVLLPAGYDAAKLEKKLSAFMESHIGTRMKTQKMFYTLHLEALKDVYMKSKRPAPVKGSTTNTYIFSIIAAFILLIAMINFVNLATARATERAREVGVRKAVGAYDTQLKIQFLYETVVLSLIAFVLSLILCQLLLPAFNVLAGKEIAHNIFKNTDVLWFLVIAIGVGLVAGIYPAAVLSSYKPVVVLKGAFHSSTKGLLLRSGLVVFQFVITIFLIAGVIIIYNQLSYLQNHKLGFKKDQVMVIDFERVENIKDKFMAIKQQISQQPGVKSAAFSSAVPGGFENSAYSNLETKSGDMQASNINLYFVDFDFVKQYQLKILAGRGFSSDMASDSTQAMLVNESVVSSMGYSKPEDIIGKRYSQWGREGKIIGVIQNFNYHSLKKEVSPLTMRIEPGAFSKLSVNVSAGDLTKTMAGLEKVYREYAPNTPFNSYFLDEAFDKEYRGEYRFGRLVLTAVVLAIILATLGLLGLISYIVVQRTKEIGIRKILGASVSNILFLLSKDFLTLVIVALLIATPLAWYVMYHWLQDFAYRISIEWWVFVLAGAVAVIIAIITVSLQTVKAAFINPVRSLKSE